MPIEQWQREWWWIPVSIVVTGVVAVMLRDTPERDSRTSPTPPRLRPPAAKTQTQMDPATQAFFTYRFFPSFSATVAPREFDPAFYNAHLARIETVRALAPDPPDDPLVFDPVFECSSLFLERSRLWARHGHPRKAEEALECVNKTIGTGLPHMPPHEQRSVELWDPDERKN